MTSLLNSTANLAKNTVDQGVNGISEIGKQGAKGVEGIGNTIYPNKTKDSAAPSTDASTIPPATKISDGPVPPQTSEQVESDSTATEKSGPGGLGLGGVFQGVTNTVTTGASTIINPAVQASKAGGEFIQNVSSAGFDIGKKVASTGADTTKNVLVGTADLAGTAIGGVVTVAADASGKVFEPVASGLKAIHGLEGLGEGLEAVNGLPMKAVKEFGNMSLKALNMSGFAPTFFDSDGDGVVTMDDTIKGLIVLGLEENYAHYAAYALHACFSYSTSDSWIPPTNMSLPIHIDKMDNMRWGKNWGSFERMDWCNDVDVETFFEEEKPEDDSTLKRWKAKFTKGRQYFGVLLLIFEWGTTWPFYFPPDMPIEKLPFKDEMGMVVRKLILPTIFANYQRSRGESSDAPPAGKAAEKNQNA